MLLWYKDKKGVSPVVGVILMVAATIVIAAIVMGFLGGFKAPKRPLDIELGNAEAYYNNSTWVVTFTIAGSEANVLTNGSIECTVVNDSGTHLPANKIIVIDHSILKVIGSNKQNKQNYYYVNDKHPKLRVVVKYKPTGQILFDNIVVAYNTST